MMEASTAQWLFGICFTCIAASFGFAWRCYSVSAARMTQTKDEFNAYKLHVAENFASVAYAGSIERRTVDALAEIKQSLRRQDEKLDRLMEERGRRRHGDEG